MDFIACQILELMEFNNCCLLSLHSSIRILEICCFSKIMDIQMVFLNLIIQGVIDNP